MAALKLISVGTSTGVVVPREVLARLNVSKGDMIYIQEASDGSFRLTPYDPAFVERMNKVDDIMRRYRNTLHRLAQ